jgi:hypothetical protein
MAEGDGGPDSFEVGVAIVASGEQSDNRGGGRDRAVPGYEEATGRRLPVRLAADRVVMEGGEAVRAATEAIAGQIGLAAQRIAAAVEAQTVAVPGPGDLSLESVDVSFGITLCAGVQALFTAQADSSAQVTITLARRSAGGG